MTISRNALYLIIGALVVVTAVVGYQLYQERQKKAGIEISVGDRGISIEAAGIDTSNGVANDVFLIDADCDTGELAAHLSRAPTRSRHCMRLLRLMLDPR